MSGIIVHGQFYLFSYLFMNAVSKLFLEMHLFSDKKMGLCIMKQQVNCDVTMVFY